jgi:hypothetical protein
MTVAQPALEFEFLNPARAPFGSVVARQLSVWPFTARTARLFLLLDPSIAEDDLRGGLLRAMQKAYFASDCHSQTRAVREAALAAHYVLRHRNRDVLPLDQVNAATAVAALRGDVAYVALAGHAAVFAWRNGDLAGQRGVLRLPRPLGLEQDPLITLWSSPLESDDRLILVCGATWRPDSSRVLRDVLASTNTAVDAEEQLAIALGNHRPAGVQVIIPSAPVKAARQLRLVAAHESPAPRLTSSQRAKPAHRPFRLRRWLTSLFGVALLATVIAAALTISSEPPRASSDAPQMAQIISGADRVDMVSPSMAVRLGPSGVNVVDLAAGDDALYTLDVGEGSVRSFALGTLDQQPTPETLVARTGTLLDGAVRRLGRPIAIQYVGGALLIVDQARSVVQVGPDRVLVLRSVPSSLAWQALGALGSDTGGHLFFVDSGSRRVLEYPPMSQRVLDPPQLLLDSAITPGLPVEHIAELVGADDSVVMRFDDGSVHRFGQGGIDEPVLARPSDGYLVAVRSIAADRGGGLFLADPANARILQVARDGSLIRQLRDPALAGVRQIRSSLDGQRVFGLVASGVLVFDTPPM